MRRGKLDGLVFDRLTVVRRGPSTDAKHTRWVCVCVCGREVLVQGTNLRSGHTTSCGCKRASVNAKRNTETPYRKYKDHQTHTRNQALNNYKQAAKRRGIAWELSDAQALNLFNGACFYCGSPPSNTWKTRTRKGVVTPFLYNGIDRIDNARDYVIDNVVSCCSCCNYAKRKMTLEEFRLWVSRVYCHLSVSGVIVI